jgi:hypothetical protein
MAVRIPASATNHAKKSERSKSWNYKHQTCFLRETFVKIKCYSKQPIRVPCILTPTRFSFFVFVSKENEECLLIGFL